MFIRSEREKIQFTQANQSNFSNGYTIRLYIFKPLAKQTVRHAREDSTEQKDQKDKAVMEGESLTTHVVDSG